MVINKRNPWLVAKLTGNDSSIRRGLPTSLVRQPFSHFQSQFVRCINQEIVAEIQENDSDAYIKISCKNNTFFVQAQIGGSHEDNIYIEFITGSKALLKFTKGLSELLKFNDSY
ncbi:hypothetical protein [Paenibacillus sp. LHD-38]|uniref:hypothetical protein n=1 Tax=Paenibacillus sp. LHD-38 TaxID=3072143 RepID=UPI0028105536|nr:hypothetical protein [Paenibacillus sp. LHD-38]MDQ8739095.1 hypothetical protein [Paenibacillus sp. LHD-38]